MKPGSKKRKTDVLLVLGHDFHIRNYIASGLAGLLLEKGIRLAVVAPGNRLSAIKDILPRVSRLYSLDDMRVLYRHHKLLSWLRLGSMVSRRNRPEYKWKVKTAARSNIGSACFAALWLGINAV